MSYPNNISDCIRHIYPDSKPLTDWSVSLHGDGKITFDFWNDSLGEKPTEEQLNAVSEEAKVTAKWLYIRKKRYNRLKETDEYAVQDRVMSDVMKKYRQDLRDLPASDTDPYKIVFPSKPE